MKADLTLPETRAAFMAQYLNQKVFKVSSNAQVVQKCDTYFISGLRSKWPDAVLSLRPISSLTEEEIGVLARIEDCYDEIQPARIDFDFGFPVYRRWDDYVRPLSIDSYDFLRSIGILIPYRGNSCEELIAANLAVYRKEGE